MAIFKLYKTVYVNEAGKRVPPGTPGAKKVQKRSRKYYAQLPGQSKRIPLCGDKQAAKAMYGELIKEGELKQAGMADKSRRKPLAEHLAEFKQYLQDKGNTLKHARQTATRVQAILAGCQFTYWAELRPSAVVKWLAKERSAGRMSIKTSNYYLSERIKSYGD